MTDDQNLTPPADQSPGARPPEAELPTPAAPAGGEPGGQAAPAAQSASATPSAPAASQPPARPAPAASTPPEEKKTNPWLWIAIGLIVVIVAAAIYLLVGQNVTVPDVIGKSQTTATQELNDAGLKLGDVATVADENVAPGQVVEQDPTAGASVKRGASVALKISGGAGTVNVPNLEGMTATKAESTLSALGLVAAQAQQYDADVESGNVIAQVPVAGTALPKGSTVVLAVSKGDVPPTVAVPAVVGKVQSEAQSAVEAVGLKFTAYQVFDSKTAAGNVIAQLPAADSKVAPGSEVKVLVSKGPGVGEVTVPNIVGQQESAAVSAVQGAGLVPSVYRQFSDTVAKGIVIGQLPSAGSKTGAGSEVGILVSLGPDTGSVKVPELTGDQAQASATLEAAGLVPYIAQDYSDTVPAGNVAGQLPEAGSLVPPQSTVIVMISKGPAPEAQPE